MSEDAIQQLVATVHARTMLELREALRAAGAGTLQRIAVDIVPALFRNDYSGEAASSGEGWAEAIARPAVAALPSHLVRVHAGSFGAAGASGLLASMRDAGVAQAALVMVSDVPLAPELRETLLAAVPWVIDMDGLVNLMINAAVGVTIRGYETRRLDPGYFR